MLQVCYLIDSETEQVEWLSALEGAVAKIVRSAAGMEDEVAVAAAVAAAAAKPAVRSEEPHNSDWARRLEAGFTSASKPTAGPSRSAAAFGSSGSGNGNGNGNPMVKVVGFSDTGDNYDGGGGTSAYGNGGPSEYGNSGAYSSISGCCPINHASM